MKRSRFSGAKKMYAGISTKLELGFGGWYCPCCNKFGTVPNKMKRKARRMYRRIAKQTILNENN